jgi:hypothetical protein
VGVEREFVRVIKEEGGEAGQEKKNTGSFKVVYDDSAVDQTRASK